MAFRLRDRFSLVTLRRRLAHVDALPQLSVIALLAGLITGVVTTAFRLAFEFPLQSLLPGGTEDAFETLPPYLVVGLPLLGGLALGIAFQQLRPDRRQIGVVHVMERLAKHQGHLPLPNAATQFLGGIGALLSGQSAGREGPAIHLGAAAASLLGQRMRLPNNSIRNLVGCGTAAAIAASFNTPLAGVIFAMEVVMLEYTVTSFIPVIVAAVTATLVTVAVFGNDVAFSVPALEMRSLLETPFLIAGGFLFGSLAVAFIALVQTVARLGHLPVWLRFTAAGAVTGGLGLIAPQILGIGYDTVDAALLGELGLAALASILLLKLLASAATVGLGVPAGLIGPILVIGAVAGGVLGIVGTALWPEYASGPAFYVLIGMGAMMAAVLQAPLAALMAILELSANPAIILPAMLAIVVATLTSSQVFGRRSLFVTLLEARGLSLDSDPITLALQRAGVGSQMERRIARLPRRVGVEDAREALAREPRWIVIDCEEGPDYVLAAADLARYLERDDEAATEVPQTEPALRSEAGEEETTRSGIDLLAIPGLRKDVVLVQFQATLHEAMARLEETGREAVCVTRTAAPMITPIIGVLTREDIEKYYGYRG